MTRTQKDALSHSLRAAPSSWCVWVWVCVSMAGIVGCIVGRLLVHPGGDDHTLRKGAEGPSLRVGAHSLMHNSLQTTEPECTAAVTGICVPFLIVHLCMCAVPLAMRSGSSAEQCSREGIRSRPVRAVITPHVHPCAVACVQAALLCLTCAPSCSSGSSTWTRPQPPQSSRPTCSAAPPWWTLMLTARWRSLWAPAWALCTCWTTRWVGVGVGGCFGGGGCVGFGVGVAVRGLKGGMCVYVLDQVGVGGWVLFVGGVEGGCGSGRVLMCGLSQCCGLW